METSILSTKGQLLIPKRIRNKYGIKSGVKVAFIETSEGVVLKPMDAAYFKVLLVFIKILFPLHKSILNQKRRVET